MLLLSCVCVCYEDWVYCIADDLRLYIYPPSMLCTVPRKGTSWKTSNLKRKKKIKVKKQLVFRKDD
jgi:hypothetical protein